MKDVIVQSKLLLEYGAINGMSLRLENKPAFNSMRRNGDRSGAEAGNRKEFFALLGFDESSVARCEQVHGDNIRVVELPANFPLTDGLVTRRRKLLLAVSVADCVPVLIFDRKLKVAAAVHSGWKGTAKNVVGKTVKLLVNELNSKPEDIITFIGPAAGVCCYEIGEEVARQFDREYVSGSGRPGKSKLDLKRIITSQLVGEGMPERNIEVSEDCTICDTNYHSYRREGKSSGRMLAAIAIE